MNPIPNYTIDEEVKQINLFDQRFYQIDDKDIFNVTGWLEAFPKGQGFNKWLKETKNPDEVRDEAAQLGSKVHKLIELTLSGEKVNWFDVGEIEVWERYLGWCNFWYDLQNDPDKTLGLKNIKSIDRMPKFTEFIIYDKEIDAAGTVDKEIKITFKDDSIRYAIIDWKSGGSIYDTAYIQTATYATMVKKKQGLDEILGFIVQINPTLNKKGYRVYEVENIDAEFGMFLATQKLYLRAFGQPKPKYRTYPTEVTLETIKPTEVK